MCITNNLRNNLQEWRDRLYNAPYTHLNRQLDSFITKLENTAIIKAILLELLTRSNSLDVNPIQRCEEALIGNTLYFIFEDQRFIDDNERAMYHYSLLKVLQEQNTPLYTFPSILHSKFDENTFSILFVERYIDPLVFYLSDQIAELSSILYLLEKYKKRCEWFYKEELLVLYENHAGIELKRGNQEEVLDQDLRKFLFEQGIDYPFSQPSSPSGKADVVSLLHTNDPLVLEVKIFDRNKGYGKEQIIKGFRQIVSYANDYNKSTGYLLVFNMDEVEINIITKQNDHKLPTKVIFAEKTYFFIFINIFAPTTTSASTRGRIKKIELREEELTSEVST